MQKIGVKTLSIIDTISELAQNDTLSLAQLSPPVHKKKTSTPIAQTTSVKADLSPISSRPTGSSGSGSSGGNFNGKKQVLSPKKKREDIITSGRRTLKDATSNGHTPDWIREIFDFVRKGNLDKLTTALQGLESTLIRNITDHAGNNLIHGACLYGHVRLLPFLAQKFGPLDFNGALSDVNSKGLTPATLAVKLGHSDIVEWLVRQSTASHILLGSKGSNAAPGDEGGRGTPNGELSKHSLLHAAAKYGQNDLVSWLSDEMIRNEADVDQLDKNGNSPLHIAAKNGNVSTLSTLLHHGANVYLKNDLGLKALDVARISPKGMDAAEFLLLYETSLGVSKEYLLSSQQEDNVSAELRDLKTHFKDVLNVSKKLVKERHEICKEFSRILESLNDLQRNISSQLSESNKRNINNNNNNVSSQDDLDSKKLNEAIESSVGGIRDKLSHSHRTWFSGNNSADFEHKILKAEEGWSKINKGETSSTKSTASSSTSSSSSQDNRYPQRHLRDRLEELRSSNSAFASSLKTRNLIDSEDEDYEDDGIVDYLSPDEGKPREYRHHRKKLPTPPTSLNGSMEESVYSSLSNEMYSKIGSPPKSGLHSMSSQQGTTKAAFEEGKRRKRRSREELRQKLKECALSSESAAVIEVIEPTSSEEEEFKKSMMEISWGRLVSARKAGNASFRGGYSMKDLSPTKKLLEMGISASSLASPTNVEYLSDRIEETNSSAGSGSNRSSVNSLSKKKKSPRPKGSVVVFSPAPEEHILPDRLECEDTMKQKKKKAWYEVVSEDEAELPEVDSLATIISSRKGGASSDDDEEIF